MSSPYEIVALLPNGMDPAQAVSTVHRALVASGGGFSESSFIWLARNKDVRDVREPIEDTDAALARMAAWPTGGTINYQMPEFTVLATFRRFHGIPGISFVSVSIPARALEGADHAARDRYEKLAQRLHEDLQARRTIMARALGDDGPWERAELKRLGDGRFEGKYFPLDLRRE
jgi:hypothetical protein